MLSPTFRRVFRLSFLQVGLLSQLLSWVALLIEPVTATMIDLSSRRRLMAVGSTALAISMLAMGSAPSYLWLLVGFGVYGVGSGPLAHTADVVVVEAFPAAPERAFARATFLDTVGALAGPALVAAAGALGVSWRLVLIGLAASAAVYSLNAWTTPFPPPPRARHSDRHLVGEVFAGVRATVANPRTRQVLIVLFCFEVFEAAFVLKYIWLHETVGLSEAAVALWAAAEQVVDLVALALLDRWLERHASIRVFRLAAGLLIAAPIVWVLAPGVTGRILLGVPLAFGHALIWPLAKPQSLTAEPALAGATQAVTTLFSLVPLALIESGLAETIGTGRAMAATAAVGAAAMLGASFLGTS